MTSPADEWTLARARALALELATDADDLDRIVEYDRDTILRVLREAPSIPKRPRQPSRGRSLRTQVDDWIDRTSDLIA